MTTWAEGQPRTWSTLNTLQFHLALLGYFQEAAAVQREAVALSSLDVPSLKTSGLLTLARLERQAANFPGALHALEEAERAMPADKGGFGPGPWRHFVKEHFLLVPEAPDEATARRLLAVGDQHLHGIPRLWMDGVLTAAIAAAEHLCATDVVHRYHALQQAADRNRDDELRKAQ